MPNHVHLIAIPRSADGLRRAFGEVHRRYTRMVNVREGRREHLWQGRFASSNPEAAETWAQTKVGWLIGIHKVSSPPC
jgi:REP element-mobilizing transposase RayT